MADPITMADLDTVAGYPLIPSAKTLWAGLAWLKDIRLYAPANATRVRYVRFLFANTSGSNFLLQINECDADGSNDALLCRYGGSPGAPTGSVEVELVTLAGIPVGYAVLAIPSGSPVSPSTIGSYTTTTLLTDRVGVQNSAATNETQWIVAQSPVYEMFNIAGPGAANTNLRTILKYTKRFNIYRSARADGSWPDISRLRFRHFRVTQPTATTAGQILFQIEQQDVTETSGTIVARYNQVLPWNGGSGLILGGERTYTLSGLDTGISACLIVQHPDALNPSDPTNYPPPNIESVVNTFETAGIRLDRVSNSDVSDAFSLAVVQRAFDNFSLYLSEAMLKSAISGLPTVSDTQPTDRTIVLRQDGTVALKVPHATFRVKQGINILGVLGSRVPSISAPGVTQRFPDLSAFITSGGSRYADLYVASNIMSYGCDYIRLLIDPAVVMRASGTNREAIYDQLRAALDYYTGGGLKVLVVNQWYYPDDSADQYPSDPYTYDTVFGPSGATNFAKFKQVNAEMAAILASEYPEGTVCLEPMNEPTWAQQNDPNTGWHAKLNDLLDEIRSAAPYLPVLIDGAGGQVPGILALTKNDQFDSSGTMTVRGVYRMGDPYFCYSFHFYEPFLFTHQNAPGFGRVLDCVPWPAALKTQEIVAPEATAEINASSLSESDKTATKNYVTTQLDDYYVQMYAAHHIAARMAQVKTWAAANFVARDSIIIGEFGAFSTLTTDTTAYASCRVAWDSATIRTARSLNMALCYWTNYLKENLSTLYNSVA